MNFVRLQSVECHASFYTKFIKRREKNSEVYKKYIINMLKRGAYELFFRRNNLPQKLSLYIRNNTICYLYSPYEDVL